MHDASYWGCLQLSGQQRDIVGVLESIRCVLCRPAASGGRR